MRRDAECGIGVFHMSPIGFRRSGCPGCPLICTNHNTQVQEQEEWERSFLGSTVQNYPYSTETASIITIALTRCASTVKRSLIAGILVLYDFGTIVLNDIPTVQRIRWEIPMPALCKNRLVQCVPTLDATLPIAPES